MGSKNRLFAEGLSDAVEAPTDTGTRPTRLGMGVFAGRTNRLAELASGALVNRTLELVEPARCRMWAGHNRDYAALTEDRCRDLIESFKAQGRQEVPALVRRLRDVSTHDFEVICGARRHWSISWLRAHNYPEFRFLVEVRDLTDEEAFRLADLENRARDDISDLERARDYLRALEHYYEGRQNIMAERINVSPSWLSRYLDLARLPADLMVAFGSAHDLGIRHITMIKPLLKPDDRKRRVLAEAAQIAIEREGGAAARPVIDVIRRLTRASDAPTRSASPKKSGSVETVVQSGAGKPLLHILRARGRLVVTLPAKSGAERSEVDAALAAVLDEHWS